MAACLPVVFFYLNVPSVLVAQGVTSTTPGFTLTLSQGRHGGEIPKSDQVFVVKYTNISNHLDGESWCSAFGAFYNLVVTYEGVPIKETAEHLKRRKGMEAAHGRCSGSNPGRNLEPGQSREDTLYYETKRPGVYTFTVEQDAFPGDDNTKIVVRSNVLTIIVTNAVSE